jgi:diaminopimelate epimerase
MNIQFYKYHALGNDFIVIMTKPKQFSSKERSKLTKAICARHTGVGADGVLFVQQNGRAEIYNADGSWAERSGNGLRIAALHLALTQKKKHLQVEMGGTVQEVVIGKTSNAGTVVSADFPPPNFLTKQIPMKASSRNFINQPLKIGNTPLPLTALSVGNPHAVLFVDSFDFDWKVIGADLETHRAFPNRTNVEFVKIINRHLCEVRLWERGVGETSSSGTGSMASVCAGVMLGLLDRKCEVKSVAGTVSIEWNAKTDRIILSGPVSPVSFGVFQYR